MFDLFGFSDRCFSRSLPRPIFLDVLPRSVFRFGFSIGLLAGSLGRVGVAASFFFFCLLSSVGFSVGISIPVTRTRTLHVFRSRFFGLGVSVAAFRSMFLSGYRSVLHLFFSATFFRSRCSVAMYLSVFRSVHNSVGVAVRFSVGLSNRLPCLSSGR